MTLSPPSSVTRGLPAGLVGALAATRYVGGTTSGAPVTGPFLVGDFVVTQDGSIYICTVAGSPGTWVAIGGGGGGAPQQQLIPATLPIVTETNFDNLLSTAVVGNSGMFIGGRTSDNADGAFMVQKVTLVAADYTLVMCGWPYNAAGILRWSLDDGGGFVDIDDPPYSGSAATSDQYSAASNVFFITTVATGITIPTTDTYLMRVMVDGKNASSGGFATNYLYSMWCPE